MNKILSGLLLAAAPFALTACGVEVVDAGHTGVKKVYGDIKDETYAAGIYFVNPFSTQIIEMDNRIQRQDGETEAYTKDVQQATIKYVLNFSLSPEQSAVILTTIGKDYNDKIIPQVLIASIKNTVGQWNAMDLIANRQKVGVQIQNAISEELSVYGIKANNVELVDISYTQGFENAVEAKVTAVQRAEEAKNTTVKVTEEANQRIIAAKADAEAMQIKTKALATSQSLVLYEAVQKWNGVLPKIISGDSGSILNIPSDALQE